MSFRIQNDEDEILAQINIIPLVDVSLVLLIIFIATVNHILTPSIKIKLPQTSHTQNVTGAGDIDVSISREGIIYLGKDVVTPQELRARVADLHKAGPGRGVVLNVDKSVYFQRVVDALDALNGLGITKLDLRTVKN